jgi:hypothetical protein
MEKESSSNDNNNDQQTGLSFYNINQALQVPAVAPVTGKPVTGIPDNFSDYLTRLNLYEGLNIIVLSSSGHYYYEPDEMKDVQVLINLKQLNHINQLNEFLKSVYCIIPIRSLLIGCFADSDKQSMFFSDSSSKAAKYEGRFDPVEHGIESRNPILNRIYNFIDVRTNRYLTKKLAVFHIEDAGLRVLDMTEINGLTYFCAQKYVEIERKYS